MFGLGEAALQLAAQQIIKAITQGDAKKRAKLRAVMLEIYRAIRGAYAGDADFR